MLIFHDLKKKLAFLSSNNIYINYKSVLWYENTLYAWQFKKNNNKIIHVYTFVYIFDSDLFFYTRNLSNECLKPVS